MALSETPTKGTPVFNPFASNEEPYDLIPEMKRLLDHLETTPRDTEEYTTVIGHLETLIKLHESTRSQKRVSPDKLVDAAVSVLGLLLVVNHERIHVITTKALDIARKTR